MSVPTVSGGNGAYVLTWGDHGVKATATRFKETDSGCTCEVRFTSPESTHPHLHHARVNLLSTPTRRTLANTLEEVYPTGTWPGIVEQFSYLALEAWRNGEPVEYIHSTDETEELGYQLEPFLLAGKPTIVYGPGGIGKSTFCLTLASMVASGAVPADVPWSVTAPGDVVFLDYEDDAAEARRRLKMIANGLGTEVGVHYRRMASPIPRCVDQLLELRAELAPTLFVVDSLALAAGGDSISAECATQLYSSLRQLDTTALLIAHPPKNSERSSVYGSAFYEYLARSIWVARGYENETGTTLVLRQQKRNSGRKHAPIGVELTWTTDAITVATVNTRDIPEEVESMSLPDRIGELLLDAGRMSPAAIAQQLGVAGATVRSALKRLVARQRVERLTDGTYGMACRDRAPF